MAILQLGRGALRHDEMSDSSDKQTDVLMIQYDQPWQNDEWALIIALSKRESVDGNHRAMPDLAEYSYFFS